MVIYEPEITEIGDESCLSARVEIKTSGKAFPDRLWFKFPNTYREYVTDRADCFAVSLLPLAMMFGENLEIHGTLSPRLAYGLREYQRVQHLWKPEQFKSIEIKFNHLNTTDSTKTNGQVGCAFSGGVDSFYTLWSHLPQNEQNTGYRISHALMINGFDLNSQPQISEIFSNKARQFYEPIMNKLGLELIVLRNNIRQFMEKDHWQEFMYTFGSVLIASALSLGHLFSRFYIASSFQYTQLFPWGSHPFLDHLLSTETTDILHDGSHLTRTEKVVILSQWPDTYSSLRTCLFNAFWENPASGPENCCRCERCVPMMSLLDMLGMLDKYTVFPKPLNRKNIRNIVFFNIPEKGCRKYLYAQEIIDFAKKAGRNDVIFDLRYAIFRNMLLKGKPKKVRRSLRKTLKMK